MLRAFVKIARPVKIVVNTPDRKSIARWGQIRDAATDEVLHTGQIAYIRSVALHKYNTRIIA